MSSEFDVTKTDQSKEKTSNRDRLAHLSSSSIDSVAGLQAAIQAAILVSGDDDDQFRYVKRLSEFSSLGFDIYSRCSHQNLPDNLLLAASHRLISIGITYC